MNNKSFSNRLSWRIIGIAAIIFFVSFILIGVVSQFAITHRANLSIPLVLGSNLVIVGILALIFLYFLCRKEIRRMTRPITELSVSALNMGKGNFRAQLPEITSKDEMLRLRNSFVYMQNSISDYISELKTTRSDNERMESELNVARTIQMGMLNTNFPPNLHALLIQGGRRRPVRLHPQGRRAPFRRGRRERQRRSGLAGHVHYPRHAPFCSHPGLAA